MKTRGMKIRTKMVVGSIVMLSLVILLGVVSFSHTQALFEEARALYDHPLQVRQAISDLKVDILNTRVGIRDLLLSDDPQVRESAVRAVNAALEDGEGKFDLFYSRYLGPTSDIDAAYNAYNDWRGATEYRILQAQHNEVNAENLGDESTVAQYREELMSSLLVIERFAQNKADELNASFMTLNTSINMQLFLLCASIFAMTVLVSVLMIRSIRRPLQEITNSINMFHEGDMNARSVYRKNDEFGELSESFNSMADSMQKSMTLHQKAISISDVMLSTEGAHEFFRKMLGVLAEQTGAQMAAVYLYDEQSKEYRHFESVGLDEHAKESFDAEGLEGIFGPTALSGKTQILRDIPQNTKMALQSPCCRFIPREIMTIPVLSKFRRTAMVTLACVGTFNEGTDELIESILPTLSARIEGVLAYQTIQRFSEQMEKKNQELDAQKEELATQAAELTHSNVELEMQKQQLEEAGRLKTSFLSNMSHELRTPLNSIIALSGVLSRRLAKEIPEEEYGYLDVIERNGKNLLNLINEILDISRIEAGREEVEAAAFSINELLEEVVSTIRPQADQKGIKLTVDAKAPRVKLVSDAGKCRHIFINIIGNAVKFTEKGKVRISIGKNEAAAKVTVTDTGVGIPPEHLPHIFDEFRQADGGTARRFGGSGLGLSIAKKYAELLGGSIAASSEPGQGSVFTVTLPLEYTDPPYDGAPAKELYRPQTPKAPAAAPATPGTRKTILVIEDSEPAIIQIRDLLKETGHRVLAANSAAQAFEVIKADSPDAIILDLMMPEVDGFETLRLLRESRDTMDTPVLILTAKHITRADLQSLKKNHIHQLIQKGDVDRAALLGAISAMLNPPLKEGKQAKKSNRDKQRILVVEDNPDNLITVKALLKEKYEVAGAVDGREGVAAAVEQKPDLILMDIELPGMNGIEAYDEIRKHPALDRVPVVALTASTMEEERSTILAHGFDAFIAKPIVAAEFFKVIGEVLDGK